MMRNPLLLTLCAALCIAASAAASGGADSFRADADATGTVILWFFGQEVTADVKAGVSLSGTLLIEGVTTSFSMVADAVGSGTGNLSTLAVNAWVAFDGQGKTESGALVTVTGGISVDALDPATTSTSGQGSGHFYFLITTPDGRWIVDGKADGGASGSFVVPDDPLTMQMTGSGSFALSGEPRPWSPTESASLPDWPAMLIAELARQTTSPKSESGE